MYHYGNGEWTGHVHSDTGKEIKKLLDRGMKIVAFTPYSESFNILVPEIVPFLDERNLRRAMRFLFDSDSFKHLDYDAWQIPAKALNEGFFRSEQAFRRMLNEPLMLRLRIMLDANGVQGLDTQPSMEENVRMSRPWTWIELKYFLEAYPNMKTLEFFEDSEYYMSCSQAQLFPYLTEKEIMKFAGLSKKKSFASKSVIEAIADKMADGTFVASEFFVKTFYTGAGAQGRIRLIRAQPSLAYLMTKSDFMGLLDVKGVLQYGLDRGWVTRFNHDEVYNSLVEDEDKAILLKWDEEHGMQAQMEKLNETRRNSDAFSTSSMRRDWSVYHSEDGVVLTLRQYISSDTLCVPAEVGGKQVCRISTKRAPGDVGDIPWQSLRKVMFDSAFGKIVDADERAAGTWASKLFRDILDFVSMLPPECVVETYGEGPLRAVPGALLIDNTVIYRLLGEELILPEGVTRVPSSMFMGAEYKRIVLPDSLRSIGKYAFKNCLIEEIDIPCSVGDDAFGQCRMLRKVRVNGDIEYGAFSNCPSLSEVELGPGVRRIDASAFSLRAWSDEEGVRSRLRSIKAFRAAVDVTAFDGRHLSSAVFVGCDFRGYSNNVSRSLLGVDDLKLINCKGNIPVAKPSEQSTGSLYIEGGSVGGNFQAYRKETA